MKIGVLAVQGAFIEHIAMLQKLGVECVEIRQKKDLEDIDGFVFPGGESTVQGKLLKELDLFETIKELIADGTPVLATCAGLILLAQKLEDDPTVHLGTLPVTVKRNAYGRQLGSFCISSPVKGVGNYPMVFIRAPYIVETDSDVTVLSTVDGNVVGVQYENQIGLSFHPELTQDSSIHAYFVKLVKKHLASFNQSAS